jgi:hypothetical protein
MPVVRWRRWRSSYSLRPAAVLLLFAVLRWSEPKAVGVSTTAASPIKLFCSSRDLGRLVLDLPLSGHRGGGVFGGIPDESVVHRSSEKLPGAIPLCAQHTVTVFVTVILGQDGGPSSSSMAEALLISCWSSTLLDSQVVRPRPSSGSQGLDLVVGNGRSSLLRSELGGNAWGSPAFGGRGAFGLDCFFHFLVRVFLVKWRAPSSNVWFLRARDVKGSFCNLYLPHGYL